MRKISLIIKKNNMLSKGISMMHKASKIKEYTRISELETENAQLKEELKFKGKIIFKDNMCYKEGDDNAYCSSCYGDKNKFIHLHIGEYSNVCPICKVPVTIGKIRPKLIRPNMRKFM